MCAGYEIDYGGIAVTYILFPFLLSQNTVVITK